MPKRLEEIKNFHTGIISTPDEGDVPIDASPNSLNIESRNVDGRLEGIPKDTNKVTGVNATQLANIVNDDAYHTIYYDSSDKKFKKIDNLQGNSPIKGDLSESAESSVNNPKMTVNNREVHIGTGYENTPKWAGFIENEQFDNPAPTTLQLEDATLISPSAFTDLIKFVQKGNYIYGVELNGKYVYKFNSQTKAFVGKSQEIFASTKSLCLSGDESHLWVLDELATTSNVIKVDLEEMVGEFSVVAFSQNPHLYTDIIVAGDTLWIAQNYTEDADGFHDQNGLYRKTESSVTAGSSGVWTFARPNRNAEGINAYMGSFVVAIEGSNFDDPVSGLPVQFQTPRISLVDLGVDNAVGWFARVKAEDGNLPVRIRSLNSGTLDEKAPVVYQGIFRVANDATIADSVSHFWRIGDGNAQPSNFMEYPYAGETLRAYNVSSTTVSGNTKVYVGWGHKDQIGNTFIGHVKSGASEVDYSVTVNYSSPRVTDVNIRSQDTAEKELIVGYAKPALSSQALNAFEGKGSGRWMQSTSGLLAGLVPALESNVNITFEESPVDYGDGSDTPNAKIGFTDTGTQFYKISYMYDGYQEGPLSDEFISQVVNTAGKGVRVQVELRNLGLMNRRISHICLYRADADNRNANVTPNGFYRLVDIAKLNVSWSLIDAGGGVWSDFRRKQFIDNNTAGASYEARTGISEVLTGITPSYDMGISLNNTHFIANIKQDTLGHLSNYVLKSKPLNFDQFNYVQDFLALPTTPTAMVGFNGRLYCFDENNTYRIEPNSFYIEDIYEGVGCKNRFSVVVTEYGLFFADKNNIYMHNGQTPRPIGNAILKGSTSLNNNNYRTRLSYHHLSSRAYLRMAFDANRNALLVIGEDFELDDSAEIPVSNYNYFCWAYTLSKGRWDLWQISEEGGVTDGSNKPKGILHGPQGQVLYSDGTNLKNYMGHSTQKRNYNWNSKELSGQMNSVDKRFVEVFIAGTPSSVANLYIDGVQKTPVVTDNNRKLVIPASDRKGKKLRIELLNQSGVVDSIGVIYRPLGVTSDHI